MTTLQMVARTTHGLLQGMEDEGVLSFRGIPFAQPPLGPLRFRAPQPAEPWSGVRDATAYGPAPLQAESYARELLGIILDETSEDCLTLNVWTPALDEGRRPVMVWIYGGAFVIGGGSQGLYNGARLAARGDVVVVTLNYRLGLLGFLRGREATGGALDSTGNEGMLDQVAALRWVRDNIAGFGGDPNNVTIFGESAGSISVAALLTMPLAKGLFHKAIMQSGSLNLLPGPELAADVCRRVLADLGVAPAEAARLRDIPTERLMETQNRATPRTGGVSYAPIADGDVIPSAPFEAIRAGSAAGIPVLIGTNRDEAKLFRFMDPTSSSIDEASLRARAAALAGDHAERLIAAYRDARAARGEDTSPGEIWFALSTDWMFRVGAMKLAALQAAHTPATYAYLFTWSTTAMNGMLGAAHALELPFVFGRLDDPGLSKYIDDPVSARVLSEQMQDAWLAFARTGNPATPGLPDWPAYDAARRATMLLGPSVAVEQAPIEAERAAWESLG